MAAQLEWLDAAFAFLLRSTLQASLVVLVILVARRTLRRWLTPGSTYALWLLVAAPLAAPLFPSVPLTLPTPAALRFATPRADAHPSRPDEWRVEYGPVPRSAGVADVKPVTPAAMTSTAWLRVAAFAWMAGVVVLLARVALSHAQALRRARHAPTISDGPTLALLGECLARLRSRRAPRLVATPPGTGPALLGILRPKLLLPERSVRSLSRDELRFVLLHELVHLKRADVAAELLLTLFQVVQWFNPLIWMAAARCRADREVACDAAVLSLAGDDDAGRVDYGRTILRLATDLAAAGRPLRRVAAAMVGILETRSPLERRLRMITSFPRRARFRWPAALVALFALGLVACSNTAAPEKGKPGNAIPLKGAKGDDDDDAALARRLELRIVEVNFDEARLSDAVDFFREKSGANIFVNWKALQAAGVGRDAPVSARMRDIKFGKALRIVLASAGSDTVRLAYALDEGVITISTAEDLSGNTETRVYDVRDLLLTVHNYGPEGAGGGFPEYARGAESHPRTYSTAPATTAPATTAPAPTAPAATAPSVHVQAAVGDAAGAERAKLVEQLAKLIQETVDPDSWRDHGGSVGAVRETDGQFIVTQIPENHAQIAKLLEVLRETRGMQVRVEARFVVIDDALLAALPPDLRKLVNGDASMKSVSDQKPADLPEEPAVPSRPTVLTPAQVEEIARAALSTGKKSIHTAPSITLFNGQSAYVLSQNQRAYIADYTVVKAKDGTTRYEPQRGVVNAGVVFEAGATISADRKYVTLSVHPQLSHLASFEDVPWDRSPPGEKLTVQSPKVLTSELRTTASIPDGQTLLLGGLTAHFGPYGNIGKPAPDVKDAPPVIMLVTPTIMPRRNANDPRFPRVDPPAAERKP